MRQMILYSNTWPKCTGVIIFCLFLIPALIVGPGCITVRAQEDVYRLAAVETFGALRRPPVDFPHAVHEASLGEEACDVCHHEYDTERGRLIYRPDEEQPCMACHNALRQAHKRTLRQAYHGSCTACHRQRAKASRNAGPTTCGGCHRKP